MLQLSGPDKGFIFIFWGDIFMVEYICGYFCMIAYKGLAHPHLNLLKEVSLIFCYSEIFITPEGLYWIILVCFMIVLSLLDYREETAGHKRILLCIIKYILFPLGPFIFNHNCTYLTTKTFLLRGRNLSIIKLFRRKQHALLLMLSFVGPECCFQWFLI